MAKREKKDVAQIITDRIIEMLENIGDSKWERPWNDFGNGLPHNPTTGRTYQGTNSFWLMIIGGNFASTAWAGYNQWKKIGATVRGGEKATHIMVPISYTRKDAAGNEILDSNGDPDTRMSYKAYPVFNSEQVDGWEAPKLDDVPLAERLDGAEKFFANTKADVREGNDSRAYYNFIQDFISLPPAAAYKDTKTSTATENLYAVMAHEFTHWTGHESRCDRDLKGNRGVDRARYAFEELVAEIGAAMLCAKLGISATVREDHAEYIQLWLKALKGDKKTIIKAAGMAQKAIDWLDSKQRKAAK
jgi:antirestriction protein ArdC